MINRKPLKQIFESNGCDKAAHNYSTIYSLLGIMRQPTRILEIGVFEGASIRSWHEAFNDVQIVGIDNNSKRNIILPKDRNDIIFADAKTAKVKGEFTWIIDDGSHKKNDVQTCFEKYWKQLEVGGWYIIEDLHCAFPEAYPDYGNWWAWLSNTVASNLHQFGKEEKFNKENPPQFGMVFQDKSIIAIQKR